MNYEKIFESDRINFVKFNKELVDDYLIMVNDEEVQKLISHKRKTYTKEQELEWIQCKIDEKAVGFSMIEKDTNEFIGNIEMMNIRNNIGELGICITPTKQDKHYGREAIKRFIDYAFNELKLTDVELNVFTFNPRAIKCYEKSGFVADGTRRSDDEIHMIYQK